jgi:hypothetical protein
MQYRKWLKMAASLGLCINNWPDDVEVLGPHFSLKKLGARSLTSLVSGYIENVRNGNKQNVVIEIVKWADSMIDCCCCVHNQPLILPIEDIALDDYAPLKGLILLVLSVSGVSLHQLRDSKIWVQRFAKVKKTTAEYASSDESIVGLSSPIPPATSPPPDVQIDSPPPARPQKRT